MGGGSWTSSSRVARTSDASARRHDLARGDPAPDLYDVHDLDYPDLGFEELVAEHELEAALGVDHDHSEADKDDDEDGCE
jgi:hypothetical protein